MNRVNGESKCPHCNCWRLPEEYIGKRGVIVKHCQKCRDIDARRSKRPDVREVKNARQREKKYYEVHRIKKREENEQDYLNHNAEIAKNWRDNNKEHVSKYKTQNFAARFRGIKEQAQIKKIIWNEDLTDEICYKLMTSNCEYCNVLSDKTLNGIDRMDSNGIYELSNCISCCKTCNFMKGGLDPQTFIKRIQHISKKFGYNGEYNYDVWSNSNSTSYNEYLKRANKKKLVFNLSIEKFSKLINNDCYYCNKKTNKNHTNGIDRKNNNDGYMEENCVSCCGECNFMKGSLSDIKFIEHCKNISDFIIDNNKQFTEDINICLKNINIRKDKPVIEKTKIIITKQQPNKEKIVNPPSDYIHSPRVYVKGTNLPENLGINHEDIPKYCYYISATEKRGDGFCCDKNHPIHKDTKKDWSTTRSKKISTKEKFDKLMEYINNNLKN